MFDIEKHKTDLLQEEAQLELELTNLGHVDKVNNLDWTAVGEKVVERADLNMLADADEEQETRQAIVNHLEVRLANVKSALKRITDGTYGTCTVCGEAIEPARLDANPATPTCIKCAK